MPPYDSCVLCPRLCRVNRGAGGTGFCGESDAVRAACAVLHFGEEPPITGAGGSGTVFFTGCTLRCAFCQNIQVSRGGTGAPLGVEGLSDVFLALSKAGAENVNIVTGTHFAPSILEALAIARRRGLSIPVVWNSSGYETPETVDLLGDAVDIWLPDMKTLDPGLSRSLFHAADYPDRAREAILSMARLRPPEYREGPDGEDTLSRGVIVRHLVLPGHLDGTRAVLRWFAENLADRALLSLMFQYTPIPGTDPREPFDRTVSPEEYETAMAMLDEAGIEDGFVQEPGTDGEWLPDFTRRKPFPSGRSRTVWHFDGEAASS
jgi:putative pyruvate formate lyase activating enzyme